jgi:hypothetical protein
MRSVFWRSSLFVLLALLCGATTGWATNVSPSLPTLADPVYEFHFQMINPGGSPVRVDPGAVSGTLLAPVSSALTLPNTQTSSTQSQSVALSYTTVVNGTDGALSLNMTNPASLYGSSGNTSADVYYQFEVVGTPSTTVPVDITFGTISVASDGTVDVTAAANLYASTLNPQTQGFFSQYDTQLVCGHAGPGYGGSNQLGTLDDCRENSSNQFNPVSIVGAGPNCSDSVAACDGGTTNGIPVADTPACTDNGGNGSLLASGSSPVQASNVTLECDLTAGEVYTLGLSAAMAGPEYGTPGSYGSVLIDPVITLGSDVDTTQYALDLAPGATSSPTATPEPDSLPVLAMALAMLAGIRPLRAWLASGDGGRVTPRHAP